MSRLPPLRAPAASMPPGSTGLHRLAGQAEAACAAPPDEMRARIELALALAARAPALLPAPARRTRSDGYARHLLHEDPQGRYAILAIAWAPGQFSPVHGHHAWCGYAVLGGELEETSYRYDAAAGMALPDSRAALRRGATRFAPAGLADVHKLGNAGDNDAWSLHVYGAAGAHLTRVNHVVSHAASAAPTL